MTEKKNYPAYKGEGIAVWVYEDKNGNKYLSVSILGNINLKAFKYDPPKPRVECADPNDI